MGNQPSSEVKASRESGTVIHRRETNRQIYLPFLLGIFALIAIFMVFALPLDPVWRDRAQAMGDFLHTLFCIIPLILCLFPIYITILLAVYGMTKLHDGAERPLHKLENLTSSLAERIETVTKYINGKTTSFSDTIEPLDSLTGIFDTPVPSNREDNVTDEPRKPTGDAIG